MDPRNYNAAKNFSAKSFDPKILLEQKPGRIDPWARVFVPLLRLQSVADGYRCYSEAWRYTGPFARWHRFKGALPGLGIATVAFAGYCVYEQLFLKDDHTHAEGH